MLLFAYETNPCLLEVFCFTLFTSIKLYANSVDTLISNIEITVFTYDTEDDFDEFGN